jgi:glyoxylase-like metal-dependent hydrolase (beta-lactamase superfamily II)
VERFVCGPLDNNVYLVHSGTTGGAVLIDASFGSFAAHREFSKKCPHRLEALLLTHGHWDHMAEAVRFAEMYSIPVLLGAGDREFVRHPTMGRHSIPGLRLFPCEPTQLLANGDELNFLGHVWRAIAVAGHTPGGIAYYLPSMAWVFSGDTLFRGAIGRSDLPGGDGPLLLRHIRSRLLPLDDSVRVFPGHGASTTIGGERVGNPYLA